MKRFFLVVVALAATTCGSAAAADSNSKYKAHFGEKYAVRDDGPLLADVYVPEGEGRFPGVLVVHGGAWRMGSRSQLAGLAARLAEQGFTAVAINYRLAPAHPFPAQIEDCQDAVRWMRSEAAQWKIDTRRIGGLGYSAGGHLVALLGALNGATFNPSHIAAPTGSAAEEAAASEADDFPKAPENDDAATLQAVVAGGAPCDFRPLPLDSPRLAFWLGGTRREKPREYELASPAAFVSADDPPMFFFHGEADRLVPVASPERMCQLLGKAGVEQSLHLAPRLGHTAAAGDRESLTLAVTFLKKHLQTDVDAGDSAVVPITAADAATGASP